MKKGSLDDEGLNLNSGLYSVLDIVSLVLMLINIDQSIQVPQDDYSNQQKMGTLPQILRASRQERGRVLNALDLPQSLSGVNVSHYTTKVLAWRATQDHPFCKDR
jgi:hypothetical protein